MDKKKKETYDLLWETVGSLAICGFVMWALIHIADLFRFVDRLVRR